MKSKYKIDIATPSDVEGLARVHIDTWRSAYTGIVPQDFLNSLNDEDRAARWQKILTDPKPHDHTFVAKDAEGNVIGFSSGGKNRDASSIIDGEIYAIYLLKEWWGQGIGKALFLQSLERLFCDGFLSTMLWVLEDNPTRKFYEAMDGKQSGEKWEEIGGKQLKHIAYSWSDIQETLKKLRPEMRHPCIKHYADLQEEDASHYRGSDELLSIGSPFGRFFGFERLGIHHELLKSERRTSWPHAESTEDEFIYVIKGSPEVWIDGKIYSLKPGDGVGFKAGTGIAHTFINNTSSDVRLLVVGDRTRRDNKIFYPLHQEKNVEIGDLFWTDHPKRPLGDDTGMPSQKQKSKL